MSIDLDELADRATAESLAEVPSMQTVRQRVRRRQRRRHVLTGVAIVPLAVLVGMGGWALIDQGTKPTQIVAAGGDQADSTPSPAPLVTPQPDPANLGAPVASVGDFVWPAPTRDFATFDALVDAFVDDVLKWPAEEVLRDRGTGGQSEPQWISLMHLNDGTEIAVLAVPSPAGWGFVQVGNQLNVTGDRPGEFILGFEPPAGTVSTSIEQRYADGTIVVSDTSQTTFTLHDSPSPQTLISALLVYTNERGDVIGVDGRQFTPVGDVQDPDSTGERDSGLEVPNVVGLTQEEALARLGILGLRVAVTTFADTVTPPGTVIDTDPGPGTHVDPRTIITITIAAAP